MPESRQTGGDWVWAKLGLICFQQGLLRPRLARRCCWAWPDFTSEGRPHWLAWPGSGLQLLQNVNFSFFVHFMEHKIAGSFCLRDINNGNLSISCKKSSYVLNKCWILINMSGIPSRLKNYFNYFEEWIELVESATSCNYSSIWLFCHYVVSDPPGMWYEIIYHLAAAASSARSVSSNFIIG